MMVEPVYRDELATVYLGDAEAVLAALPAASVDAVVTDPPYGLGEEPDVVEVLRCWLAGERYLQGSGGFMGKRWDAFVPDPSIWRQAIRVLRPGGPLLCFAGTRTADLTGIGLRLAGFEIRDEVLGVGCRLDWLYGSGLPSSLDVSKAIARTAPAGAEDVGRWRGWGTGLKPAHEPILLARRPLTAPSVATNVLEHGAGALNIEGCRLGRRAHGDGAPPPGRWPANVVLCHTDGCRRVGLRRVPTGTAVRRRGVVGGSVYSRGRWRHQPGTPDMTYAEPDGLETIEAWECAQGCPVAELERQSGDGASRFFYVAKASTADRNAGLHRGRNRHPTVKPVELMRWLVRLATPPGGLVLDCYAGTGSTLVAAKLEGLRCIGIDDDSEPGSVDTCVRRLGWAMHQLALLDGGQTGPVGDEQADRDEAAEVKLEL